VRSLTNTLIGGVLGAALLVAVPVVSASQHDEDFYDGRTIEIIVGYKAGGGYDTYARLVARHLGKYIPGKPEVTVVNRPGAGSIVATNYLYSRAPKDGTAILIPSRELVLSERLGTTGVRYKTLEMPVLGSAANAPRIFLAGPDVPVDNLEDLANFRKKNGRDFRFATDGKGSGAYQLATLLGQAGYPVQAITGYQGTTDTVLAVLRGETDGLPASYDSGQDAIRNEGFKIIARLGNHSALADVEDIRRSLTGKYRSLANVLAAPLVAGRPFFTAPGTPPERVAILREAFRKALEDPQLQAEAERASRPVSYTGPEEMTELYREILNAPDEVIEQFRD
jgi:tripartite-type tricarboxylate transporter receptor subunit TctC